MGARKGFFELKSYLGVTFYNCDVKMLSVDGTSNCYTGKHGLLLRIDTELF